MLVTTVELSFPDQNLRYVSVPVGTEAKIFNRQLHPSPEAEELLALAKKRNAGLTSPQWLVVLLLDHPRLLQRSQLRYDAQPIQRPKKQAALF